MTFARALFTAFIGLSALIAVPAFVVVVGLALGAG